MSLFISGVLRGAGGPRSAPGDNQTGVPFEEYKIAYKKFLDNIHKPKRLEISQLPKYCGGLGTSAVLSRFTRQPPLPQHPLLGGGAKERSAPGAKYSRNAPAVYEDCVAFSVARFSISQGKC